ncbi:MAG TPA: NAD(P)-binding domain-containing protein [Roseiarcus sp.]
MKVGIIGSGVVGQMLAAGFAKHGHQVEIGTRDPAKLKGWSAKNPDAKVKSFAEAEVSAMLSSWRSEERSRNRRWR